MRASRRSTTSDWVAALRALYSSAPDGLDVVRDPVALGLLPPSLALPLRAAAMAPSGPVLAHRAIALLTRGLSVGVPLRTAAIDEAVRAAVERGTRQIVVLGAGLDARAWRMPELARATVYELDHPSTQAYKRERIAGREPLAARVCFCAIDFERQTLGEVLGEAGFDAASPAVFLWEGVTMYLTSDAVDVSLDAVASLAAPGSRLAMTYVPPDYGQPWERAVGSFLGVVVGEELRGLVTPRSVSLRLALRGFRIESDDAAPEWASRYWPEHARVGVRAYERLALAVKA